MTADYPLLLHFTFSIGIENKPTEKSRNRQNSPTSINVRRKTTA